jgi:hypothetical protein
MLTPSLDKICDPGSPLPPPFRSVPPKKRHDRQTKLAKLCRSLHLKLHILLIPLFLWFPTIGIVSWSDDLCACGLEGKLWLSLGLGEAYFFFGRLVWRGWKGKVWLWGRCKVCGF